MRVPLSGRYKQIGAVSVAAGILFALVYPFQSVTAFEANLALPYNDPSSVPQSPEGVIFLVTIDIAPNELLSLSQIELILDNDTPDVKHAVYSAKGIHVSGDTDITMRQFGGDLTVGVPAASIQGYGYAYGMVSYGTSFVPPYSYSFTAQPGFLSGNEYGYSYSYSNAANLVNGFMGPGLITIAGKLNTAAMSTGDHTLDVLVHTGSGGDGVDKIVAPQLEFNLVEFVPAFEAALSGSEEVPPVDTDAIGLASFTLSEDETELQYTIGISSISNMTQAHIHLGAQGENGPVVAFLFEQARPGAVSAVGLQVEGVITSDDLLGPLAGSELADLIAAIEAGNAYVNVHTTQNPAGEIRGQILTTSAA
jgi:hypothetical protein